MPGGQEECAVTGALAGAPLPSLSCGARARSRACQLHSLALAAVQVELWDCSGDRKYENCWTAILRDAQGVVLVYDPTIKEQEKDIELW